MEKIVILDFGSQYTQIIARKIRELNVYAEIYPFSIDIDTIKSIAPNGIILSGGPSSVYTENAPIPKFDVFSLGVPVLGICYGLQLIAYQLGGEVNKAAKREYGRANLIIDKPDVIFDGVSQSSQVWMSHGDSLTKIPDGFEIIAHTENAPIAAIRNQVKKIYGVQFHPEVHHSVEGIKILENFVRKICLCKEIWDMHSFVGSAIKKIQEEVGNSEVICALSGGVDSTVLAVLLSKAIGNKLHCIHIDTGLMRLQESEKLMKLFNDNFNISIDLVNASDIFLSRLKGVTDPELKRKIIGNTFIELFEIEAKKFNNAKWLAQGTLYPDVIESVSVKGPSAVIKSHHNVGGLPEKMGLKLIEPFRELFKDEVRAVGRQLGVPEWFIRRHPFPGPGLAIRIIGEITQERIEILQKADDIYIQEITEAGLYDKIWQAFAVLLPVQSVGVMGDERTYENVCALRAVTSVDGMTADWFPFPYDVLAKISNRIINEIRGINRVVYDITSKPPGTIEWE
ncbi:MAG TPA: glutamine-hydrolyzing GMP synthase [Candidatus Kapabacteria bacterium]|nr:glutamine-hydrolyzing GMP synthase [Candidatus Kapabacteria bacterium]HPU24046.1 glutamine-hydrolyzing GMP synthase [Candidatus Kapabacteria bacterium]